MANIRVLIADDHAVLRAGLRMLLNAQLDIEVVGEAADSREALTKSLELAPDVLTLDLTMPGGGSIKIIERLRQECPHTRVVVLTMHDDSAYLQAALAAGGSGYVVKTAADAELLKAIRAVFQGRTFINSQLNASRAHPSHGARMAVCAPGKSGATSLSQREREVLILVAQGHSNKDIADRLSLSVKTIETYRARITEKLGLRSRAECVRYALELGLLSTETAGHATRAE